MNIFAPIELCKKLEELGCVTTFSSCKGLDPNTFTASYCALDFIGPCEEARENCRKVFGDRYQWLESHIPIGIRVSCQDDIDWSSNWEMQRHRLLDQPTYEAFWDVIACAVKEVK